MSCSVPDECPQEISDLIDQCSSVNPSDRPTAVEALHILQQQPPHEDWSIVIFTYISLSHIIIDVVVWTEITIWYCIVCSMIDCLMLYISCTTIATCVTSIRYTCTMYATISFLQRCSHTQYAPIPSPCRSYLSPAQCNYYLVADQQIQIQHVGCTCSGSCVHVSGQNRNSGPLVTKNTNVPILI